MENQTIRLREPIRWKHDPDLPDDDFGYVCGIEVACIQARPVPPYQYPYKLSVMPSQGSEEFRTKVSAKAKAEQLLLDWLNSVAVSN